MIIGKIKCLLEHYFFNKLPACRLYKDVYHGDYDCDYHPEFECERCVCVDYWKGLDPRTGNKFKKIKSIFSIRRKQNDMQ